MEENTSIVQQEETGKEIKKKFIFSTKAKIIIACSLIALILIAGVITLLIVKNNQYTSAIKNMEDGNYSYSIGVFEKLGNYKESKKLLAEAQTAEKYEQAVQLFSNGDFESAQEAFAAFDAEYKDTAKYLASISYLQKISGNWSYEESVSGFGFIQYEIQISGPYSLKSHSKYSDCDWGINANIKMHVKRWSSFTQDYELDFSYEEVLSHQTEKDEIYEMCMISNKNLGKKLTGVRGDYSIISIEPKDDGEKLKVYEVGYNTDYTTSYGSSEFMYFVRDQAE